MGRWEHFSTFFPFQNRWVDGEVGRQGAGEYFSTFFPYSFPPPPDSVLLTPESSQKAESPTKIPNGFYNGT
ncbi:hypothetical protein D5R40_05705 [Okeania hirsuta]|uniref:Uncharacterized protein n=1 Tax=Okeania hirsuta TaxID=1458930 RepID=A0A3N6PHD2_9CYAN|nr:hypothetical protein D4Z78_02320 [Okeania hirsuta]RQH51459.1 hypothetical protein D5R40_05705 [Okeania hirsuta]